MTVTWKDYKGPNLGARHLLLPPGESDIFDLERYAGFGIGCCVEEVEARKKWADEQNALTATEAALKNREAAFDPARWTTIDPIALTSGGGTIRVFDTGALRDTEAGKLDFEGFLSPLAVEAFATFMNFNRELADGSTRDSDNWQKGIPKDAYIKSGWRHFVAWWRCHRGVGAKEGIVWALCGVLFNAQGYLHELLKDDPGLLERSLGVETQRRDQARSAASGASSSGKPSRPV